jgi:hypothetical protein
MKYMKALILCLGMTAALLAFVGVGTAAASEAETTLCKAEEGTSAAPTCSEANMVTNGTVISAHLKSGNIWKLQAGPAVVECSASEVEGKQEQTVTSKGAITLSSDYDCATAQDATTVKLGTFQIHWKNEPGRHGNWTIGGMEFELHIGSTVCKYGGSITSGITVNSSASATSAATLVANANVPRISGALCNNPAKWEAEYEVTAPKPLYVAQM